MKKIKRLPEQVSGGALDDQLDPKALAVIAGIKGDQAAMREAIEGRVGWFRMLRDSRQTEPQPQELMEHLQRIQEAARFVGDSITSLPMHADALLRDKVYHIGVNTMKRGSQLDAKDQQRFEIAKQRLGVRS